MGSCEGVQERGDVAGFTHLKLPLQWTKLEPLDRWDKAAQEAVLLLGYLCPAHLQHKGTKQGGPMCGTNETAVAVTFGEQALYVPDGAIGAAKAGPTCTETGPADPQHRMQHRPWYALVLPAEMLAPRPRLALLPCSAVPQPCLLLG